MLEYNDGGFSYEIMVAGQGMVDCTGEANIKAWDKPRTPCLYT